MSPNQQASEPRAQPDPAARQTLPQPPCSLCMRLESYTGHIGFVLRHQRIFRVMPTPPGSRLHV